LYSHIAQNALIPQALTWTKLGELTVISRFCSCYNYTVSRETYMSLHSLRTFRNICGFSLSYFEKMWYIFSKQHGIMFYFPPFVGIFVIFLPSKALTDNVCFWYLRLHLLSSNTLR